MKNTQYKSPIMPSFNDDDDEKPHHEPPLSPAQPIDAQFEKQFIDDRKVFLWGEVDDKSAKAVVNRLLFLEAQEAGKEIKLYINSPGGVVTSGLIIYDTIQLISSPVSTICMGLAASMGSILLSVGAKGKRYIFPNAEVMIHQPSLGGTLRGVSIDLEIQATQMQKCKDISAQILAKNCNQPIEKILADFERDYWMDANEAVKYGIVDKILTKL